jgi:hypothetical protein
MSRLLLRDRFGKKGGDNAEKPAKPEDLPAPREKP